ncbi:MAG: NAD(P)H-dependent oxidoreductase subunit E [Bryobacteraceae bacterium]
MTETTAEHGPLVDVVMIDDEETFTEGCRQTLEMGGYRAAVARDGPRGLDLVRSTRPRVVLVDLKMPGMDGLQVLTHLSETAPATVPIVVTGHGTVDSAVESMKIGAFDFLSKPFDPEKLLESVRRGISLSELRKTKASPAAKKAEKPEPPAPQDKNDLVLRGLGVLGEAYSLGMEKRQLLEELSFLEAEAKYHAESLGEVKRKERVLLDIRHDLLEADAIMEKYGFQKGALIQIMLDVQEKFHWLPRYILHWITQRLNVPAREVYTIANFYEAFSLEPRGRHRFQVCTGTACHVRGAPELLSRLETTLDLKAGQTDARQMFTLETVHCLGCCALAPVVQIDNQYHRDPSRKKLEKIIETYEKQEGISCRD